MPRALVSDGNRRRSLTLRILDWGFRSYVRRFIRRNFNAVRVAGLDHVTDLPAGPVVCFMNHPGWWDPMTGVFLTEALFPTRQFAAPMDADALKQYPILGKLGFFPITRDSPQGARTFLRAGHSHLSQPDTALWITPTGRFSDVRESPSFQPGLSRLVTPNMPGCVIPVAVEYTFWNERYPEMLIQLGQPCSPSELAAKPAQRSIELENQLAMSQAALAKLSISREPELFETLAVGRAGIGGFYDAMRRFLAAVRGRSFEPRHEATNGSVDLKISSPQLTREAS